MFEKLLTQWAFSIELEQETCHKSDSQVKFYLAFYFLTHLKKITELKNQVKLITNSVHSKEFIANFKGCVRYIFASLFLSLNVGTFQTRKNVFYLTSKALSILEKTKF